MNPEPPRLKTSAKPHWLSVCLILTVFFLPLHFHVTSAIASQVSKECICLHGTRIQANATASSVASTPVVVVCAIAPLVQAEFDSQQVGIPSSRAPPRLVSL